MHRIEELLSSWDKLEVIGMTADKHNSILTLCGDVKVAIEFRYDTSSFDGMTYTLAYLVAYTETGDRVSVQSYGCHDHEQIEFHKWFAKKKAEAIYADSKEERRLKEFVNTYLS